MIWCIIINSQLDERFHEYPLWFSTDTKYTEHYDNILASENYTIVFNPKTLAL